MAGGMNRMASLPWQQLDTRPYTPGMFGPGGPVQPLRGGGGGGFGGGGGGVDWGPTNFLGSQPQPTQYDANGFPLAEPGVSWRGGGGGGGGGGGQTNWTNRNWANPNWANTPIATQGLQQRAGGGQSFTSPGFRWNQGQATSNPLSQAMGSYMQNMRAQVPSAYQQYLPASFGF